MNLKFKTIKKLSELEKLVSILYKKGLPYGFDLETTGLNPWRDSIVGASIAWNSSGAVYIPIAHQYDQPFDGREALEILKPLLEGVPFVAHNLSFEVLFLKAVNIIPHRDCYDSRVMAFVKACYLSLSLSSVAKQELDFEVWSFKDFMKREAANISTSDISFVSIGAVTEYCGRDALATYLLYKKLYPQVKNNRIYRLEVELFPVILLLRETGVLVDKKLFNTEEERLRGEAQVLKKLIEAQCSKKAGEPLAFNIQSSKQVGDVLFKKCKMKCYTFTPTNQPSTAKASLSKLKWKYPIVGNILIYREIMKRVNTYYKAYMKFAEKDGRIHASFNQTGAPTGRFSCSDPNLQNIPDKVDWKIFWSKDKSTSLSTNIREGFIASEGYVFVEFDYSQIEARVEAGVAQEPILLNAFKQGVDYHTKTASLVFNVSIKDVTKYQRQIGKKLNFALGYGMGSNLLYATLSEDLPISFEKAKQFKQLYVKSYPTKFRMAESINRQSVQMGYVETIFGRRIPLTGILQQKGNAAYPCKIQGTAADILKIYMLRLFKFIKKKYGFKDEIRFVVTVHDSVLFEVSNKVPLGEFIKGCLKVLIVKIKGFPVIEAKVKVGRDWGSLHDFKEEMVGEEGGKKAYILELSLDSNWRGEESFKELKKFFISHPGNNEIYLKMGEEEKLLPFKTSLDETNKEEILLLVGGDFYEKLEGTRLKGL